MALKTMQRKYIISQLNEFELIIKYLYSSVFIEVNPKIKANSLSDVIFLRILMYLI